MYLYLLNYFPYAQKVFFLFPTNACFIFKNQGGAIKSVTFPPNLKPRRNIVSECGKCVVVV